ncbi:MAG TPA: hypothetical protein VFY38_00765 [Pseudonocardia sp.]|nr:hypothetical protein [Pseudonocardia sp.]
MGGDGSGWLWDRQTGGRPRQRPEGTGRRRGATFSPDGTRLATVEDDGTLLVRDVATLAVTGRFSRPGTALAAVSFSPDGTRIAAAGSAGAEGADGGEVLLLDGADLALVQRLPTGSQPRNPQANATTDNAALGLAFSPDGTVLAVPLSAGRVTLWNLADPQAVPRSLEGHGALALDAAFTPDGTMLATAGGDRRVRLWSVADGTPLGELESESAVRAVAFSPDGTVLAAASQDYLLRLWSMPDRRLLALLNRHSDELNDVAFDDEGRLISTGADGSAQVWDLDPDCAVATLCDRLDPAALSDDWRALGPDLGDPPRCPS